MPDVVGTTSSEATATLRDAGFEANVVAVPSDLPSGQVVAQSPAAGSDAPEGSTVRLNVAQRVEASPLPTTTGPVATAPTEPEPATVPDVVGDELADAARAFGDERAEGVRPVRAVGRAAGAGRRPGPAGRHRARARGTPFRSTSRMGRSRRPIPRCRTWSVYSRLLGATALTRAGFEVLALEVESNLTGEVVSQWRRRRPGARSRAARSCCSTSPRPTDAALDMLGARTPAGPHGHVGARTRRGRNGHVGARTRRGRDGQGYFGAGSSL